MALTQILDHVERAYAMLPEQFKGNVIMRAMLKSWARQIQDLEDVLFDILDALYLGLAEGVWLDRIGAFVGEPRLGATDDNYRIRIRAQIRINLSNGTIPDLLTILRLLADESAQIELREQYPASFRVDLRGGTLPAAAVELARALRLAKAGGVAMTFVSSPVADADTFMWASGSALVLSDQGWGSAADPEVGGVWAGGF